jgi:Protein of unknown function (DUF2939)
MRWTLRISFFLFLAWLIFLASPFVALYDLAKAVDARDLGRISDRVNFNALRVSLSRQILGAFVNGRDLGDLDRQLAIGAGATLLNPVVEELVTPEALVDLLEDGWPQQSTGGGNGGGASPLGVDRASFGMAWRTFIASESQGFRSITIPLPATEPKEKQFKVTLRLRGATWRLTGIDLPQSLRDILIKRASQVASKKESK